MIEKLTHFDSADYLTSPDDVAAYLQACVEEAGDDARLIAHAIGVVARARSMTQLARDAGMSREGLYKALSTEGNPTLGTVLKVVRALNLKIQLVPA